MDTRESLTRIEQVLNRLRREEAKERPFDFRIEYLGDLLIRLKKEEIWELRDWRRPPPRKEIMNILKEKRRELKAIQIESKSDEYLFDGIMAQINFLLGVLNRKPTDETMKILIRYICENLLLLTLFFSVAIFVFKHYFISLGYINGIPD